MPLYEFCAENITLLEKAFQAGARRVELCDNLAVGGTTPSYGVIKEAVKLAKDYQAKVIVMIRPRGGDFVYSEQELDIMLEDWKIARDLGVDGLAVGALTADNQLDKDAMLRFIEASQGFELTMHMAFDQNSFRRSSCEYRVDEESRRDETINKSRQSRNRLRTTVATLRRVCPACRSPVRNLGRWRSLFGESSAFP